MDKVPVILLLGTLGSGKTTTARALLKIAPREETWAVIVNEFGTVGLDKAIMEQDDTSGRIPIVEVPGGCICCSAQADLKSVIREVVQEYNPHRLIIEPSGLADAHTLVSGLRAIQDQLGIHIESVLGHLDARLFRSSRILEVPFWESFLSACTDIIATKMELANKQQLSQFHQCVSAFFGADSIHMGREAFLKGPWQDARGKCPAEMCFSDFDESSLVFGSEHEHEHTSVKKGEFLNTTGTWYRSVSEWFDCLGWVVGGNGCVSLKELLSWLDSLTGQPAPILRLKGILRTDDGWRQVELVNGKDPVVMKTGPRDDSRFELITSARGEDWSSFQRLWFQDPIVS